jgi:hypothetical protein
MPPGMPPRGTESAAEERQEPGRMGPALSAGVAGSPRRRAMAQAMRGGRMPF